MKVSEKFKSNVLNRIANRSWKSERRRSYLERLATLTVGSSVRVDFTNIETAACEWDDSRDEHRIQLRSEELQTAFVEDYAQTIGKGKIHTLTQEGFLYHELGHVLITDFDAWKDVLDNRYSSLQTKKMAKQVLNVTEDVVLEVWIRDYLNCGEILDFKNEVKFHTLYGLDRSMSPTTFFDASINDDFDALVWLIETKGRYDPGGDIESAMSRSDHQASYEELDKAATQIISEAVQEPDARARYNGILDAFDDVIDLRSSDSADENQFDQEPDSQSESQASQQKIEMMVPDLESDEQDEESEDESEQGSGDEESEEEKDEQGGSGGSGEQSDDEQDSDENSGGSSGENQDETTDDDGEDEQGGAGEGGSEDEQSDEELVDEIGSEGSFDEDDLEQMVGQSDVAEEDVSEDEAQERAMSLKAAGAGRGDIVDDSLEIANAPNEWRMKADQLSRHMKRVISEYLRRERKTDVSRGEEFGDFDSGRMVHADRGNIDVFKRENKPGEKEYHTVICMDDSGSMGTGNGSNLKQAAIATAGLTKALEECGIDVTVYRFARDVRIVKAADQSYDDAQDRILENRTHGSTMLLPAIEQTQKISEEMADETFLMTITDGKPSSKDEVACQLDQLDMKKMSLQIEEETDYFEASYDGFAYVKDKSAIRSQAESLFRRVVL